MENKKKILLTIIGIAVIIIIAAAAFAARNKDKNGEPTKEEETHLPCQAGDNYDIYTGEPCK